MYQSQFKLFKRSFIARKRVVKRRPFGRTQGPTFTGYHWGRFSLYVERKDAVRRIHSLRSIHAVGGTEMVERIRKVA